MNKVFSTIVHVLAVLLVVVLLAQVAMMFLPGLTVTPKKSKVNPDPQPTDYSFMEYCWTATEDVSEGLEQIIKKYNVNDYVISLVLSMFFAVLTVVFTIMETVYSLTKYKTGGAITIRILSYVSGFAGAYFAVPCFFSNPIFKYTNDTGDMVQIVCQILAVAALAIVVVRMVLALLNKFVFSKKATA